MSQIHVIKDELDGEWVIWLSTGSPQEDPILLAVNKDKRMAIRKAAAELFECFLELFDLEDKCTS